ncbi:putative phosphatase regulatory subunit, partial [Dimargaris cristalligena]
VKLENIALSQAKDRLLGTVQVQNLAFQKSLAVRYTTDLWQSYQEATATYADSAAPGSKGSPAIDRFGFELPLDLVPATGGRRSLFFCLRYRVAGQEYWDNNGGQNYHIQYGYQSPSP